MKKLTSNWTRCTFVGRGVQTATRPLQTTARVRCVLLTLRYTCRGYNIGVRMIEDFLARTGLGRCRDFSEVGEVMSKVRPPSSPLPSPPRSLTHTHPSSLSLTHAGGIPFPPLHHTNPNPTPNLPNSTSTSLFPNLRRSKPSYRIRRTSRRSYRRWFELC